MDPAQHVLLILGGAFPGEARALALAESAARIVCADSGAEHARKLGLNVHAIVGDFDSITPDTLRFFEARGAEILSRPDQQHDDFEKALEFIAATHTGPVVVLGATGLRSDHLISNLSVMLRMTDRFESLTANDDFASYRFLTAVQRSCTIECPIGSIISLMPFGTAHRVTTTNLQYPLSAEDLLLGQREGLSNVATGTPVHIEIAGGALLVTVGH